MIILRNIPTVEQTRKAIEEMTIEKPRDEIFQMALKYIYLIAGRLSEVYGNYSPLGRDTFIHPIEGEEAVIFLVKTARRKGLYRVIAVPREKEKWASELFSFFRKNSKKNPFDIGEPIENSRRYLQFKAEKLFDRYGHEMRREPYTRIDIIDASDRVVKEKTLDGKKRYLIEYPDEQRLWHSDRILKIPKIIEEEPKPFRTKHLREQRENELKKMFSFSIGQARTYLGLKQDTRTTNLIEYDGIGPIEGKTLEEIIKVAETYFLQFL
jgi:hypothetical protein